MSQFKNINIKLININMTDFSIEEKVNYLYKKSLLKPSINNTLQYFQEPAIINRQHVLNNQILRDSIPYEVPSELREATTDDDGNNIIGSTVGKTSNNGIVKKYVKLTLEAVAGSNNIAYKGPNDSNGESLLKYAIPFNHNPYSDNRSYTYTLYKNDGTTVIDYGDGEWIFDVDSGIVTFYAYDKITSVNSSLPPKITFYKYTGTIGIDVSSITSSHINTLTLGTASQGSYSTDIKSNICQLTNSENIADSIYKINQTMTKLSPTSPPNLSTKTIYISDSNSNNILYSAYSAGTSNLVSNITSDNTPRINLLEDFYAGNIGTLTLHLNTSNNTLAKVQDLDLASNFSAGTYTNFIITQTYNFNSVKYVNNYLEVRKDGNVYGIPNFTTPFTEFDVWQCIRVYAQLSSLTDYNYEYQIKVEHSLSGSTNTLTFKLDNPSAPSFNSTPALVLNDLNTAVTHYFSGIASYNTQSKLGVSIDANNTINYYYNATNGLAKISGNEIETSLEKNRTNRDVSTFTQNSNQQFTMYFYPSNDKYTENTNINVEIFNSSGSNASNTITNYNNIPIRIDTKSTLRIEQVRSGIGLLPDYYMSLSLPYSNSSYYPSSSVNVFGNNYAQTDSLLDIQELQQIGGIFQVPNEVNYANFYPSTNLDYTNVNTSTYCVCPYRFVTFKYNINEVDEAYITFNDITGTGWGSSTSIATDMSLQCRIVERNSFYDSGWLNFNKFFSGYSQPVAYDGVLLSNNTTDSVKHIHFGGKKTGILYIRIGLKVRVDTNYWTNASNNEKLMQTSETNISKSDKTFSSITFTAL